MEDRELTEKWKYLHRYPEAQEGLRPEIRDSWQRSYDYGVNPGLKENPYICTAEELARHQANSAYLIETSSPVMSSLFEFVAGTGFVVILGDANHCILKVVGDRESLAWAKTAHLVEGSLWAEDLVGTNCGALAMALASPISVFGYEHFCLFSHVAACSSAPLLDQGRVIGLLAMAAPFKKVSNHTLGMVVAATNHIKTTMELERARRFHEVVTESMSEGVLVVDVNDSITYINSNCARMLKISAHNTIGRSLHDVLGYNPDNHRFVHAVTQGRTITDEDFSLAMGKERFQCNVTCNPLNSPDPSYTGSVIILREHQRINRIVRNSIGGGAKMTFADIVGKNPRFLQAVNTAKTAASTSSNVLLLGESGTGKDVLAQAMHNESPRRNGPFLAINCAALPRELIASELFGYEDGAFTGARKGGNMGKFELADQGTIFLDEIGDMPTDLQASLLRVLEEKAVMRLGGNRIIPVNVRIIAATNKDLETEVEKNRFRRDLYYRLGVIRIKLPPLRERKDDIELLARYFLEQTGRRLGKTGMRLDREVAEVFRSYHWPGNIREMQNILEGALQLAPGSVITTDVFPDNFRLPETSEHSAADRSGLSISGEEKQIILSCLQQHRFNKSDTAKALGMSRRTLYRRLEKYDLLNHE